MPLTNKQKFYIAETVDIHSGEVCQPYFLNRPRMCDYRHAQIFLKTPNTTKRLDIFFLTFRGWNRVHRFINIWTYNIL